MRGRIIEMAAAEPQEGSMSDRKARGFPHGRRQSRKRLSAREAAEPQEVFRTGQSRKRFSAREAAEPR
jgi:hypothetical protein